jgi:glycosyltransferase involved in cell wall biosynthesis
MNEPFFTVIIPTYNRADRIGNAITSVLKQLFADFELIIVDDGSTDNTESVVKGYADARVKYSRKSNEERAAARNAGVKASVGRYVTFLDSDDLLYPQHLTLALEEIKSLNEPEVYHQGYEVVDEKGRPLSKQNITKRTINDLLFTRGNVMSCIGVFVRRDVADGNRFDENRQLSGVEDWELWIRLAAQYPIHHSDNITSALVQHAGRSVHGIPADNLKSRVEKLLEIACGNTMVIKKFGNLMPQLHAVANSYISLHLSEPPRHKKEAIRYLFRAVAFSPVTLFQRRTLAILRNVLLAR